MLKQFSSDRDFMDHISHNPVVIDQWQLEKLALVTAKAEVHFYVPGLPPEYHASLWGRVYPTPEAAVAGVTSSLAAGASIAVIPEGPYVLAKVSSV
jgi:alkanesulfonate monooxygenase SsuD/methylene tetrahydromethanopterin reductase-like flavin-dependent oxidoreductase (luciferase family)